MKHVNFTCFALLSHPKIDDRHLFELGGRYLV